MTFCIEFIHLAKMILRVTLPLVILAASVDVFAFDSRPWAECLTAEQSAEETRE